MSIQHVNNQVMLNKTPLHIHAIRLPYGNVYEDWWVTPEGRVSDQPIASAVEVSGNYVMSGMVDAHLHLTMGFGLFNHSDASPEVIAANVNAKLHQGVLAVRDAGTLPGSKIDPTQFKQVRVITCGDIYAPPNGCFPGIYIPTETDTLIEKALDAIANGTKWIKIIADFPGPDFNFYHPIINYDGETIKKLCDAAHANGARVAAHVSGPHVEACVRAGVDSIEHGNFINEALLTEMAQRNTAWVPTLSTVSFYGKQFMQAGGILGTDAQENDDLMRKTLAAATKTGVIIMAGSDEKPEDFAQEIILLNEYGLSPQAALAAAADHARAYLGLPAFAVGATADVVLFNTDPRQNLNVLRQPSAIISNGVILS